LTTPEDLTLPAYLLTSFNIVFIISDNADGNFIESANETKLFVDNKVNLKFLDSWDPYEKGDKWEKMMANTKNEYNLSNRRFCIKHLFRPESIREMNESLQNNIDFKKIWFGSRIRPDGSIFDEVSNQSVPLDLIKTSEKKERKKMYSFNTMGDMIDNQDDLVNQTKKECALIEIKSTPQGSQSFDLPQHLKREKGAFRARKDSYTSLLLGNWAVSKYFELMDYISPQTQSTFDPVFIQ
ncbi:MAG: hypothetical protein AABY22_14580, partial [Nanoarchaeota archaeon]